MEIALTNNDGEAGPSLEVSEAAFGVPYNETLVHQIVTAYMAAGRVGTKANRFLQCASSSGTHFKLGGRCRQEC